MIDIAERIQLHKLLRKPPRIAATVNIGGLALYQSKEIEELLNSSGVAQMLLHLFGGHIGKVSALHIFKQVFLITV